MIERFNNSLNPPTTIKSFIISNSGQELQKAIYCQDLDTGLQIIGQPSFNPNTPLPNGQFPIHLATCEGQDELVHALLHAGANPGKKDHQQLAAYDHAILLDREHTLGVLLKQPIKRMEESPKSTKTLSHIRKAHRKLLANKKQLSPLQRAILEGQKKEVKFLLKTQKTTTNTVTSDNCSLLHLAAISPNSDILPLLLQQGCSVNAIDNFGCSPLHYAATNFNREAFYHLLQRGNIDPDAISLLKKTAHEKDPLALSKLQVTSILAEMINTIAVYCLKNTTLKGSAQIAIASKWITNIATFALISKNSLEKKLLGMIAPIEAIYTDPLTPYKNITTSILQASWIIKKVPSNLKIYKNNFYYRPLKSIRNTIVHGISAIILGTQFKKTINLFKESLHHLEVANLQKQWNEKYGLLDQTCLDTTGFDDLYHKRTIIKEDIDSGKFFKISETWDQLQKCKSTITRELKDRCYNEKGIFFYSINSYLHQDKEQRFCYFKTYQKDDPIKQFKEWIEKAKTSWGKTYWEEGDDYRQNRDCGSIPPQLPENIFLRSQDPRLKINECAKHALAIFDPNLDIKDLNMQNPQYIQSYEHLLKEEKIHPKLCKTLKGRTWQQCHKTILRLQNAYELLEKRKELSNILPRFLSSLDYLYN